MGTILAEACDVEANTVVCWSRCEPAGGDREWSVAAGQEWSGEGLLSDQQETLPTDGRKKNKLRLYYLSWLRNKILRNDPEVEKRQGWTS
ncbi:unnamed protein product, partial [Coregonus sp. 'balchen']